MHHSLGGIRNKLILLQPPNKVFSYVTLSYGVVESSVVREMLSEGELVKVNKKGYEIITVPERCDV